MASTGISSSAVERLLDIACARNVPAEVHYHHGDGTLVTCRIRLLETDAQRILADGPAYTADQRRIPSGRPVKVHFLLNGSRYEFASSIERNSLLINLNERQRVSGIALAKPAVITDSQRRAHLRILLASYDPVFVLLARPHPEVPDACLLEDPPVTCQMIDLSAGGTAVLTDDPALVSVQIGERYFVTFELPTTEREFLMLGTVRHTRVVPNSGALRVAFSFGPWAGGSLTRDQEELARFVAAHQRRRLRRGK